MHLLLTVSVVIALLGVACFVGLYAFVKFYRNNVPTDKLGTVIWLGLGGFILTLTGVIGSALALIVGSFT